VTSLPGFGKSKVKETPEREGRNPASGEKIKIAASRKLIYFAGQGGEGAAERLKILWGVDSGELERAD
jgi:DNA-binding protein HU-beta